MQGSSFGIGFQGLMVKKTREASLLSHTKEKRATVPLCTLPFSGVQND